MVTWSTAQTGSPLTQDPSISLKNMLAGDGSTTPAGLWGSTGASGSLMPAAQVRFDTKFGRYDLHNMVIVEKMPVKHYEQSLGMQRFRINEVKRVQIWCDTKSSLNNRWLVEQECFRIINGNPLYLQGVGIDWIEATDLNPIPTRGMDQQADNAEREDTLARSYFLVKMIYDVMKT